MTALGIATTVAKEINLTGEAAWEARVLLMLMLFRCRKITINGMNAVPFAPLFAVR